jgi:hypothetical protein
MTSRALSGFSRPAGWAALALVTLAGGYFDLSRGGTSLAPVLLVLGYCVFVPLVILSWPAGAIGPTAARGAGKADRSMVGNGEYRPSYLAAGIVTLLVFVLYLATLAPSTAMWDTSEYIAATKVLGLPHPPGNPFFMLVGHVFGMLPLPVSYAARINILVALSSALAAGFWFLITERVLASWVPKRWQRLAGASAAALVGATSFTVWNQAVVAEKVYGVSLLGMALISWIMVRWSDRPDGPRAPHLLVLAAYLVGLGYTNHPAGFLPIPAIAIALLARRPTVLLRWRVVAAGIAALAFGLTMFAYEPIRAAYFPPMNEGEPTACEREFAWSCTFSTLTYQRLMANINRKQYGKPSVMERQAPFTAQVGMWWLYFKWQWLRDAYIKHPVAQGLLGGIFLLLAVAGGYEHWRRHRTSFWYFGTLVFTLTLALIFYLNFKYSWSQAPELGNSVAREPRDRDYFYVWSFSTLSVWLGLGIVFVWQTVAEMVTTGRAKREDKTPPLPDERGWRLAAPVLALALIPLFTNAGPAPRSGQYITRDWAVDFLNSVEPYSILITNGDNDTFPLWYAQDVEGVRRDVTVVVGTYLGIDWFARQLIRRPIEDYDAAKGPAIYRGKVWKKPSGPPLRMTFAQADSIPDVIEIREPQIFQHGNIVTRIQPGYLTRDQIVVLRFIRDAFPERPIYFAAGGYAQSLGLTPYLLTQGLVQKLMPDSIVASRDTLQMPNGYFDVARTDSLWTSVYRGPQEIIREGDWIDRASTATPYNYALVGELLARALEMSGRTAEASKIDSTVGQVARAARLEGFERRLPAPPASSTKGDRP